MTGLCITQGPGGPIVPISVQNSPSGRYFIVRFAYVTEASPAKLFGKPQRAIPLPQRTPQFTPPAIASPKKK